jgi:hypothetical protein
MLKHKRAALGNVTLETSFVLTEEQCSAAFYLLRPTGPATFDRATGVRIVTIGAAHFAFQDRMVMRHFKSGPHFEVALETGVRGPARIDDLSFIPAGGDVQTSGAMAGFAAHFFGIIAGSFQARVSSSSKIAGDGFVTSLARFRTDKLSASNTRRSDDGAICLQGAARQEDDSERGCSPDRPKQFFALTLPPPDWPKESHAAAVLSERSQEHNVFFRKLRSRCLWRKRLR